jgi:hypothetical protein
MAGLDGTQLIKRGDIDMRAKNFPGARESRRYNSQEENQKAQEILFLPALISENDKWKLEGCPRCRGDVFLDTEDGEVLGHCLQCGYVGARARVVQRVPEPDANF